ncbi:MarR family winged helix-turn-helix transcriptional regulator [Alicyclobacillus dauci]|uniref:MarR family winged helix-turn-helix transcriptional regulator n=1 Tax=Alicyclobacillus dauci TaxID=1475485 RepID=A0ABY6Z3Y2_9BACL|nr:MarR family winged helix-turn-helix transcriptional regulator [Alicyclobacillus dauci]WAH37598.1 MarR family winged helix-turn-helix transcriptional regulator [Alicyclobacillus dauci]
MSTNHDTARAISDAFANIYYHCHPAFEMELSHQAVRALQFLQMNGAATVTSVAAYLGCAQNTASEMLRRLSDKGLVVRRRNEVDERVVNVHLTTTGLNTVNEHTGLDVDKLASRLGRVSLDERSEILNQMVRLQRLLEQED